MSLLQIEGLTKSFSGLTAVKNIDLELEKNEFLGIAAHDLKNPLSTIIMGGEVLAMRDRTPEMASLHPFWLVYVHVKDVGKAVDIATKAGASLLPKPG